MQVKHSRNITILVDLEKNLYKLKRIVFFHSNFGLKTQKTAKETCVHFWLMLRQIKKKHKPMNLSDSYLFGY